MKILNNFFRQLKAFMLKNNKIYNNTTFTKNLNYYTLHKILTFKEAKYILYISSLNLNQSNFH